MAREAGVAEISTDGKTLICRSSDGGVKWLRQAPTISGWCRLATRKNDSDIQKGIFRYVELNVPGFVIAVFNPYGGLSFNLKYLSDTGELISIDEAR